MKEKTGYFRNRSFLVLLVILLASLFTVASPQFVEAQPSATHFVDCAFNTGTDATINVPANVSINGNFQLEVDDEIAVYTADGNLCAGVSQSWTGTGANVFPVWGDNIVSADVVDGLRDEKMQFRIWDESTNQEYIASQVTFSEGDGYYVPNSVHVLESLTIARDLIYVSNTKDGYINGVKYLDEDILAINLATGMTVRYVDFSDLTVRADVDAFHVQENGDVLFSLIRPANLPDVGLVQETDIILFSPTSTGDITTGTFSWYFNGVDVGLDTPEENIDTITFAPDGRLVISIAAAGTIPGLVDLVKDEDLIAFTPDVGSTGQDTAGTWELYFDTGDTEFPHLETDIRGAWIDPANGDIYFTVFGPFSTTSVSGDEADIIRCVPGSYGSESSCTSLNVFADGSTIGLAGFDVDGISINNSLQPDVPFVSIATEVYLDNIKYLDEDIFYYDGRLGQWNRYIDFSDVSIRADVDAFMVMPGGDILFSLQKSANLPDVGLVNYADIIRFRPTSTGTVTAGTFSWYFDGSDVGLDTDVENIDAITFAPDGRLVISISGGSTIPGLVDPVTVRDEDLIAFTPDPESSGDETIGTWEMYFDTGDTEFPAVETDIRGAWIDPANEDIYFSVFAPFNLLSVSGDEADIVRCVPGSFGSESTCTSLNLYFDGSTNGLSGQKIDGLSLFLDKGSGATVMRAPDQSKDSLVLPDSIEDGDELSPLRKPK